MSRYDCIDFKVSLSPYLDGELPAATRVEADRHLLACRDCRSLLERAERQDSEIRRAAGETGVEELDLPAGFETAVLAALPRPTRRFAWKVPAEAGRWGWFAAAACLAVAVGALSLRTPEPAAPTALPASSAVAWPFLPGAVISGDDAHTLFASSIVLEAIEELPFEDAAARERLRQIALYDDLLPRLSMLAAKIDPAARREIEAARAAIFVLLRDEGSPSDSSNSSAAWSSLQEDLRLLDLPRGLIRLSAEADTRRSL